MLHRGCIPTGPGLSAFSPKPTAPKQTGSRGPTLCEKCCLSLVSQNPAPQLSGCRDGCERPALFLGYALSLGAFAALGQISLVCTGWRRIPLQRRAVIPEGLVRFSRLLGKFDTTACAASAQVRGQSTVTQSSKSGESGREWIAEKRHKGPNAQNAVSRRSGVLRFRAGHWPPSKSWPMVFHRADRKALRSDFPCIRAAHWRCSYRMPASLWAGRSELPAAGTSLAPWI